MSENTTRNPKMVELKRFAEIIATSEDIQETRHRLNGFKSGYCRGNFYPQKQKRINILSELLDSYT